MDPNTQSALDDLLKDVVLRSLGAIEQNTNAFGLQAMTAYAQGQDTIVLPTHAALCLASLAIQGLNKIKEDKKIEDKLHQAFNKDP